MLPESTFYSTNQSYMEHIKNAAIFGRGDSKTNSPLTVSPK